MSCPNACLAVRCFFCHAYGSADRLLHVLGWPPDDGGHGFRYVCDDCVESTCTRCWRSTVELVGEHSVCEDCAEVVGYGDGDGDENEEDERVHERAEDADAEVE